MDQLERILNKLDALDEKVEGIQVEIARRDYEGMVKAIETHGQRLTSLEHYRTRLVAIGGVIAAAVSAIITYLTSK